jgi:ADP-ribose pyrophosphatase YjhB (NUDIX family)
MLLPHDEIGKFLIALHNEECKWISRLNHHYHRAASDMCPLFWVKVRVQLSHLLPSLIGTGIFTVHHATSDYIMLVKGFGHGGQPPNAPLYGTHYTRVECVVVELGEDDDDDKLLVINEMVGTMCCCGKLVTGSVEGNEYVSDAAEREVMEETGVKVKFMGIIGIVNRLCTRFNRDEILIGCLMIAEPKGQVPKASSLEVMKAEWVPMKEFDGKNYMTTKWVEMYNASRRERMDRDTAREEPQQQQQPPSQLISDFRGHGRMMMMCSTV